MININSKEYSKSQKIFLLLVLVLSGCSTVNVTEEPPAPTARPTNPAPFYTGVVGLASDVGRGFIVLDDPPMVTADVVDWLADDELVLGVSQNGEAAAFPIRQMAFHHIINTHIGGLPFLVTY